MARLIGVDVGGTFTDLIVVDDERGQIATAKVPTSLPDQSLAILDGLGDIDDVPPATDVLIHGSTVATNAVIERRGARVGLITTTGFRDVIELGRRDRPGVYGFFSAFEPLIARELRIDVDERVAFDGEVLTPLDEAAVTAAGERLRAADAEAVVVCFLHSYAYPGHERRAVELLRELWPNPELVTCSSDGAPEVGEFERFATAAANCYLQPLMDRYVQRLVSGMRDKAYAAPVLIVQSNGGLMTAAEVSRVPIATVKSGPAAGVVSGVMSARLSGFDRVITCDMGGTSFDVCLVTGDGVPVTTDWQLDFRLPVRAPAVDLVAIGAGGGSIARVDDGGVLSVGPRSAGARPGPACYGHGGTLPTVTDANLVLGRLAAAQPLGTRGDITLDVALARESIEPLALQLGLDPEAAAEAILDVAASNMSNAIRTVSIERGHDPRDFALVVFGGAGPLHVTALMREAGIGVGIVPPLPGVACGVGAIAADLRYEAVSSISCDVAELGDGRLDAELKHHEGALRTRLAETRLDARDVVVRIEGDMQYRNQHHTLRVRLDAPVEPASARRAFEAAYHQRFGYVLEDGEITLINVRSVLEAGHSGVDLAAIWRDRAGSRHDEASGPSRREVVFGGQRVEAEVHWRWSLTAGDVLEGPFVCEQEDSTTFVEPGYRGTVDAAGNLVVRPVEVAR
jgi:N-methylhydantoinase A